MGRQLNFILILIVISIILGQNGYGLFENVFGMSKPCLATKGSPTKNGYQMYQNSEHKLQIQFPLDWTVENGNGEITSGGTILWSLATFEPDTFDGYKSQLELEINDLSTYPSDLKSLSGLGKFEDDYILLSPEAKILSSNKVQINGCPAYQTVYLEGFSGKPDEWKVLQTFLIDCDKEYVMRFTGTDNDAYKNYLQTVNDIVQSFKVQAC